MAIDTRTALRRAALVLGTAAVLFTALMGFAHTPRGRPILGWLGMGCPAMKVSPEQVERLRQRGLAKVRGTATAAVRPALGLELDRTTDDDAKAWADRAGLTCTEKSRPTHVLACSRVPTSAFSQPTSRDPIDELTLAFDPRGALIQVDTYRDARSSENAERDFAEIRAALEQRLGAPATVLGHADASMLASTTMAMEMVDYRFANYLANVAAANMGGGRIVVRESYRSASPAPANR